MRNIAHALIVLVCGKEKINIKLCFTYIKKKLFEALNSPRQTKLRKEANKHELFDVTRHCDLLQAFADVFGASLYIYRKDHVKSNDKHNTDKDNTNVEIPASNTDFEVIEVVPASGKRVWPFGYALAFVDGKWALIERHDEVIDVDGTAEERQRQQEAEEALKKEAEALEQEARNKRAMLEKMQAKNKRFKPNIKKEKE